VRTLVKAAAIIVGLGLSVGCQSKSSPPPPPPVPSTHEEPAPAVGERPSEPLPPLGDASLYELDATLVDEAGTPRRFDDFRGRPVVISMFYSSCQTACPVLIEELKELVARIPAERRDEVRVLLISFDPERDTPAKLRELFAVHRLSAPTWRLATAQDDTTRELAAVLGVRYRKLDSGEFFHTSVTTVLDANGVARARMEGLRRSPDPLLDALAAMPGPEQPPTP